MVAVFARHTYVIGEQGDVVWFAPGDSCPEWALSQITNPAVVTEDADQQDAPTEKGATSGSAGRGRRRANASRPTPDE